MNHVFVDFENVRIVDSAWIGARSVSFTLFLGANQKNLDVSLVEKMLAHAASVSLIRLTASGRNALDFVLAYYLGYKVLTDPLAFFHIVSRDKGYDPLIEQLRSRHVHVQRHDDFSTISLFEKVKKIETSPSATPDAFSRILERLRKNVANRPKKKATLLSHLQSTLGKNTSADEAHKMFQKLCSRGHLILDEKDAITYHV